jgi:hypothetical protein
MAPNLRITASDLGDGVGCLSGPSESGQSARFSNVRRISNFPTFGLEVHWNFAIPPILEISERFPSATTHALYPLILSSGAA